NVGASCLTRSVPLPAATSLTCLNSSSICSTKRSLPPDRFEPRRQASESGSQLSGTQSEPILRGGKFPNLPILNRQVRKLAATRACASQLVLTQLFPHHSRKTHFPV